MSPHLQFKLHLSININKLSYSTYESACFFILEVAMVEDFSRATQVERVPYTLAISLMLRQLIVPVVQTTALALEGSIKLSRK